MRVLVTGSRTWPSRQSVWADLDRIYTTWARSGAEGDTFTVVHGHCPTGADHFADQWCIRRALKPERHPADWSKGRGAGFHRNGEMVNLGADICLAYIGLCDRYTCTRPRPHGSHGATDCAHKAKSAGIKVLPMMIGFTDAELSSS